MFRILITIAQLKTVEYFPNLPFVFSLSLLFRPQTQNCPTMYKDMSYRANKWTVDATMSMRGRERSISDVDAVFGSLQKT